MGWTDAKKLTTKWLRSAFAGRGERMHSHVSQEKRRSLGEHTRTGGIIHHAPHRENPYRKKTQDEKSGTPAQKLSYLFAELQKDNPDSKLIGIIGLSNFYADHPGWRHDIVTKLVALTKSFDSNVAESSAHALYYLTISGGHSSNSYIIEAINGLDIFGEETERLDINSQFSPNVRLWLAAAMTSAAIVDKGIAADILDDLIDCFDMSSSDLSCHIASELYQIADAHGGEIAAYVYRALKHRQTIEPYEKASREMAQHIANLEKSHPEFLQASEPDDDGQHFTF